MGGEDSRERGEREACWHASLHRHWPPSAAPEAPPPLRFSASVHLPSSRSLYHPPHQPFILCCSTGLQLPTWLNAWGPRVDRVCSWWGLADLQRFCSHGSTVKVYLNDNERTCNVLLQIFKVKVWKSFGISLYLDNWSKVSTDYLLIHLVSSS